MLSIQHWMKLYVTTYKEEEEEKKEEKEKEEKESEVIKH